ncbi:hypothetical protein EX30DRAFT_122190 [Ascodesmis nigricans]|uniref:Uncharacterized protein n=1 Tax=Ascodesmis nigricans TaxID=341454 RepID=A0A4S2MPC5_9PEZI|nr:hypothetical protein EX30DRAFT_122190 [Ascodesmis nigricans]
MVLGEQLGAVLGSPNTTTAIPLLLSLFPLLRHFFFITSFHPSPPFHPIQLHRLLINPSPPAHHPHPAVPSSPPSLPALSSPHILPPRTCTPRHVITEPTSLELTLIRRCATWLHSHIACVPPRPSLEAVLFRELPHPVLVDSSVFSILANNATAPDFDLRGPHNRSGAGELGLS